ncbi:Melanoregulin Dilute suppressor protein -like protein [Triplophysa tibetana]|uniref:Melanoregulin Dilute suppressor protein-like protein n=1 Tax=Triplophysa tibetana TaxID=1572043 RepID=A0A5A9P253_9TELE|nr:Melanoregulin Dilute suppressor protein -like protein [Triplophysa tibetana]
MYSGSETAVDYEQKDRRCRSETEVWSTPQSSSTTDRDSDPELQAFIMRRNQVDKDTEEWENLNYDIHSLKCARRKVRTRWKKLLLRLGYQREVDSLLTVNRQTVLSDRENLEKSRNLLHTVLEETGLFPRGLGTHERYLFVMDRLVSLDSAEDFVHLARENYPRVHS